jgi:hypothetical protein
VAVEVVVKVPTVPPVVLVVVLGMVAVVMGLEYQAKVIAVVEGMLGVVIERRVEVVVREVKEKMDHLMALIPVFNAQMEV